MRELIYIGEMTRMCNEKLKIIFSYMQDIFRNTMQELFVNACMCEEMSLYFFVIEILDCSKQVSFVNEELETEVLEFKDKQTYDQIVEDFLRLKYKDRRYIIEESVNFFIDNQEIKILWIFFSECLDGNIGRFYLKCVFEQIAHALDMYLGSFEHENGIISLENVFAEYHSDSVSLIQEIIQKAAAKSCYYFQKLYAPINFQFIIELSGEYYEKAECQSNMIILFQNSENRMKKAEFIYSFDDIEFDGEKLEEIEFVPSKIRLIRKLLQTAQEDLCLVLEKSKNRKTFKVLGICREEFFSGDTLDVPYIMIRFRKHMQWDMLGNNSYIFTYKNGQYKIERKIHETYLYRRLREHFGGKEENYNNLITNIILSMQQEHGTIIVIMDKQDAQNEVKRLGKIQYGFPETLPRLATEEIKLLSNIDGSVIIDTLGMIHGIGMILDGVCLAKGNPARGARYNSALRYTGYLENNGICAMLLIISEDGSVDIMSSGRGGTIL